MSTGEAPLTFALASCQYPAGLLDGSIAPQGGRVPVDADIGPADASLWRLARRCGEPGAPTLAIFCGDQVYVDDTAGLFDASLTLADRFDEVYAARGRNLASNRLQRQLGEVWTLMDDHEISDNWAPRSASGLTRDEEELLGRAKQLFLQWQRGAGVVAYPLAEPLWGARTHGGFDFFLCDTRTERGARHVGNWRSAAIFGAAQRCALGGWIAARDGSRPGFVVSPSMLLPRPLALQSRPAMALHADAWCGYPASLHEVLAWVYEAGASNTVFLSGDEHLSCAAAIALSRADRPGRVVHAYSVHSSALYAPYPFANARQADFDACETFAFVHPHGETGAAHYRCVVQTWFPGSGDGFATVTPKQCGGNWLVDLRFDGASGCRSARLGDGKVQPL